MSNRPALAGVILALVSAAAPAHAFTPQTILVDGINDFQLTNRIDADSGDTEIKNWCTDDPQVEGPMDLRDIYITNDNSFLYIGFGYDKDCFSSPQVNLGFAMDVNDAAGSTTDPFNRKIAWNNIALKPDYVVYDVLDGFNYEVLYETNGAGGWNNISTEVNPSWGGGSNGLGIRDNTTFIEYKLPLSVFNSVRPSGLQAGDVVHVEWWMTQDGTTKPPLDCSCSDAVQKSTPAGTTFDVATAVEMSCMHAYTIQAFSDVTPPTVGSAAAVGFAVVNRQFALTTNKVDVTFSEPVDPVTAGNTANYAITNIGGATVSGAARDATVTNLVHLTLSAAIGASTSFRDVTVTGVKDAAGNTIVNNGTTNVASFFIQTLLFRGGMQVGLCKGIFAPADTFSVEGSLSPLNFALCDNAIMTDANADSIYETTVPFCLHKGGNGKAEADLEWKMVRRCTEYEPLGGNRQYHLTSDNGASATIFAYWNNDDPANFTTHPIDVIFQVDATLKGPGTTTLLGSQFPLSFTPPGQAMAPIGGNVYRATARFPKCTARNVQWKVDYNGVIECFGQGDRNVYLNDALYDTVGSVRGPITMPARGIDRCTVSDKAVRVIFRVDMKIVTPDPGPLDTVAVMGNRSPLTFAPPPPSWTRMFDDGVSPDATPSDIVFTRAIDFPDSTDLNINYKYWLNGRFECTGVGDRYFSLDDVHHSVAVPQVRPLNYWDFCSDVTGVPDEGAPKPPVAGFAVLHQNRPNPFNPSTTIGFDLLAGGRTTLTVYDVAGRKIITLLNEEMMPGTREIAWDGRDDSGRAVTSGIYFYELAQAGQRIARRMVLVQ